MNFFGTVNVFPDHTRPGQTAYARPHEVDLSRSPSGDGVSVPATVDDIRISGAVVRLFLIDKDGAVIHVEMTRDRFDSLGPRKGEMVYAVPSTLRMFAEP